MVAENLAAWSRWPLLAPLLPASAPAMDGCDRIYVDMGTNVGAKLEELCEPRPAAPLPLRDGRRRPPIRNVPSGARYEPKRFARHQKRYASALGLGADDANRSAVCGLSFEPVAANARHV